MAEGMNAQTFQSENSHSSVERCDSREGEQLKSSNFKESHPLLWAIILFLIFGALMVGGICCFFLMFATAAQNVKDLAEVASFVSY